MDPQELIAQLLMAGGSAGNENPMLAPKRIPELPPDYQVQSRPYVGAEIPMSQFDAVSKGDPAQRQIERLLDFERRYEELKAVDPRQAERFKSYGLEGPATDSQMEHVYGQGAVGREMRGGDPLAGSLGMDKAGVGRQMVYPLDRRFGPVKRQGAFDAEAEAELQQEQEEREMDEQEQRGIYK